MALMAYYSKVARQETHLSYAINAINAKTPGLVVTYGVNGVYGVL